MERHRLADLVLRIGTAFAFLFPAIDGIANPDSWIGYFPSFMKGFVPDLVLLHSFGIVEVALAIWLLFGKNIFRPAVIASIILLAIVIFNIRDLEILFRDLSIFAMACALAIMYAPYPAREK